MTSKALHDFSRPPLHSHLVPVIPFSLILVLGTSSLFLLWPLDMFSLSEDSSSPWHLANAYPLCFSLNTASLQGFPWIPRWDQVMLLQLFTAYVLSFHFNSKFVYYYTGLNASPEHRFCFFCLLVSCSVPSSNCLINSRTLSKYL